MCRVCVAMCFSAETCYTESTVWMESLSQNCALFLLTHPLCLHWYLCSFIIFLLHLCFSLFALLQQYWVLIIIWFWFCWFPLSPSGTQFLNITPLTKKTINLSLTSDLFCHNFIVFDEVFQCLDWRWGPEGAAVISLFQKLRRKWWGFWDS